jgi:hypothetical protein
MPEGIGEIDPTWNRLLELDPRLQEAVPSMAEARHYASVIYGRSEWPVTLAICAVFKDEARNLAEWIDFHFNEGVERFYLYDNGSTDDWEAVIAPYRSVVEVTPWPGEVVQFNAYSDCIVRHRMDTRWLAFLDIDEFLFSPPGESLVDVLEGFPRVGGVAANWRVYGTSGHVERPPGGTLKNYAQRAPDDHESNRHVKSIVVPALVVYTYNAHHFIGIGPTVGENGDLVESPWREPSTAALLRVNHYYSRSMSEFEAKVARRGVAGATRRWRPNFDELSAVHDPILVNRWAETMDADSRDQQVVSDRDRPPPAAR